VNLARLFRDGEATVCPLLRFRLSPATIFPAKMSVEKHIPNAAFSRYTFPCLQAREKLMRTGAFLRSSLLLFAAACPALLLAQFQQPTDEELKMTADPKAPGAAAVFLNVTETADRDVNFESYYARIKVLTEKGKNLAVVELPYRKHFYKVADIKGRTIHQDGTIIPLTGKPDDLLETKTKGYQSGRKVFTLPNVEVGSILEYYYQIRYSAEYRPSPYWSIQHRYLVHKAHYQCIACGQLTYLTILPTGVAATKDRAGHLILDLEDVPPAPNEEWMPPMGEMLYKAVFYFRFESDPDSFWSRHGIEWSRSADQFIEPSKAFRDTVNGLVSPADSSLVKARKLYEAVQSLDNTDFSREKSEAERKKLKLKEIDHAEDVWTQKSGTRTEIALLYLSMLRAAGLTAYGMRVVDRNQGIFLSKYLEYDQLDDTIIILSIDGKEIVLDPGEKMCPFQTVNWKHSAATGIRQTATGSAIATTPHQGFKANTVQRIAELTLDSHGAIDGHLRFIMTGQVALGWRQKAIRNDESEVKKQFDEWIAEMIPEGVEAHIDHFIALDAPEASLAAVIDVHGSVGTATSKRLLLPGLFFETRGIHPFTGEEKRLTPVDMHYGELVTDDVTYELPPGLAVESTPQEGQISWQSLAVLLIKSKTDPGQVNVTRTYVRSFTFAEIKDYPTLRDFYLRVAAADQQQIVLTAVPAGKGN
jgi:hypothetical protein